MEIEQSQNHQAVETEQSKSNPPIELLAPAGDFDALKAAVGNGADSVYFGSNYFNARKKAKNIPEEEMEEAIDYTHLRGCRAYLTINTLLLDEELPLAVDLAGIAYRYGIDAIIVQDMGFAALLKKTMPDLVLHASTQATVYDEYAIDACACIGISRIILPRELSIPEIARLTKYAKTRGIETEVFVHGALCVCYSGQCIMSSMIGGRSGNRGECAQPCRLSYDITVGKRPKNIIAPHLATKDISAVNHIEALIQAGVTALKIEGRMRSPEYVGVVVKEFRQQIGYEMYKSAAPGRIAPSVNATEKGNVENLLLAFNRGGGFTDHYLAGKKSPDMMAGAHTGSFGVLLGEIAAKNAQIGVIDIRKTPDVTASQFPNKGDVFAIRRKGREEEIASAPIGSAVANGMNIRVKGFHPAMIDTMQIGDSVYRMTHAQLGKEVLASEKVKTWISGVLREEGSRIVLEWTVTRGIAKGIGYTESMDPDIESRSIPEQRCVEQLSKTGGTPFAVELIRIETAPAIPVSSLNLLRRESLAGLTEKIRQSFKRDLPDPDECDPYTEADAAGCTMDAPKSKVERSPEFHDYSAVEELIRRMDIFAPEKVRDLHDGISPEHPHSKQFRQPQQLPQSLQSPQSPHQISVYFYAWDGDASSIACRADWYELPIWAFMKKNALDGLKRLKETEPDARFAVALPPAYIGPVSKVILDLLQTLAKEGIEAVVSGNPGNAWLCRDLALEDFQDAGSNVMNSSTASLLKEFGAASIVPSMELSMEPLVEMAQKVFAGSDCIVELPAYGKLRLMYSEHCPVGYNRSGCKACETGAAFALKDRKGVSFPVICHKESCTVDILNGDNLCVPAEIAELANICPLRARLIFTDETQEERQALVDGFRTLLLHPDSPTLNRDIEKIRQTAVAIASDRNHGLTKGHYQRGMH